MGKGKQKTKLQNKALFSRISFLQQAATLFSVAMTATTTTATTATTTPSITSLPGHQDPSPSPSPPPQQPHSSPSPSGKAHGLNQGPNLGMARRLAGDLRSVSNKMRIRLSPAAKQAVCRFCDSVLIEGQTCTSLVENHSRGGRKPWADVLVRRCHACGKERRYPVSAKRPRRKTERGDAAVAPRAGDAQQQAEHDVAMGGAG